jgi:hypothetical protein
VSQSVINADYAHIQSQLIIHVSVDAAKEPKHSLEERETFLLWQGQN